MKLEHYPAWLREEIAPTNPTKSILCDMQENEKARFDGTRETSRIDTGVTNVSNKGYRTENI